MVSSEKVISCKSILFDWILSLVNTSLEVWCIIAGKSLTEPFIVISEFPAEILKFFIVASCPSMMAEMSMSFIGM